LLLVKEPRYADYAALQQVERKYVGAKRQGCHLSA
jgi:hypothetical protein